MQGNYRRYIKICALLWGTLVLVACCFNLLIDPFGIYPQMGLAGLKEYRRGARARIAKSEQLYHGQFDRILLGSSRTLAGIDAGHPAFSTGRTFNGGLAGASMEELAHVGRLALDAGTVKEIVLFADFFTFNDRRSLSADFLASRFAPGQNSLEFHLDKLFAQGAFSRSKKVLDRWRQDDKFKPVFRDRSPTDKTLRYYRHRPNMYGAFTDMERSLAACRRLLRRAETDDVKVTVIILPVHALLLETLDHAGLWEKWEDWKRALVLMAPAGVDVWDFQNYHDYAAAPIVDEVEEGTTDFLFFDPSHPSLKLCGMVVDRVFRGAMDQSRSGSFGRIVEQAELDAWLRLIRNERERFAESQPDAVAAVPRMLAAGNGKKK